MRCAVRKKTGAKVVHIGDAALEVIAAVPKLVGNDHLLPGKGGAGRLVHLQSTWERIREAAGFKDVWLHDLRPAFASLGAAQDDSLLIIGALLGHRSAKTTQRYAHLADHPMKDAAQRISAEAAARMGLKRAKKLEARRADVVAAPPGTLSVLGAVIDTRWTSKTAGWPRSPSRLPPSWARTYRPHLALGVQPNRLSALRTFPNWIPWLAQIEKQIARPLTTGEKNALRELGRERWAQANGTWARDLGADVHHEDPLEWAHLNPNADPNRLSNLVGITPKGHIVANRAWTKVRPKSGPASPRLESGGATLG